MQVRLESLESALRTPRRSMGSTEACASVRRVTSSPTKIPPLLMTASASGLPAAFGKATYLGERARSKSHVPKARAETGVQLTQAMMIGVTSYMGADKGFSNPGLPAGWPLRRPGGETSGFLLTFVITQG
ncbi:MAG: hypothetical protein CYG60_15880 [Actinobacteria bacterium]|nr:hypothetical protein [Actinomycetota bacterium]PLS84815.1 MAG: hypothetical protein CYG60_15880 [Actinomycetota bacterium]